MWIADDVPELEKTGELLVQLKAARTETLARDEYKWGVLYLRGDAAIERDPLAALEWLRRSAEHGDRRRKRRPEPPLGRPAGGRPAEPG